VKTDDRYATRLARAVAGGEIWAKALRLYRAHVVDMRAQQLFEIA
jgi:hypothetical protein